MFSLDYSVLIINFIARCVLGPLIQISQHLERLSLGCCEDLCTYLPQILQSELINPQHVKLLGLASMKDDPGSYLILDLDPIMFEPFINIQVNIYFSIIFTCAIKFLNDKIEMIFFYWLI